MQPEWEIIANLGDVNPFEHGAVFVFIDRLGNCDSEMSVIQWDDNIKNTGYETRIVLERMSPDSIKDKWFYDDIGPASHCCGSSDEVIKTDLCSPNAITRADAYLSLFYYNGMGKSPKKITKEEAITMYGEEYEALI